MGMPWFRIYYEMIDDPKIGTLSDSAFRVWVELLCLACETGKGGLIGLTIQEICWRVRRDIKVSLTALKDRGLIVENDDGFLCITNWEKRQFCSDSSTDRVRKYRENKKKHDGNGYETLQKRYRNVIDTDTDTEQIRTDTDKKKRKKPKKHPFPIPENYTLTDKHREYADKQGMDYRVVNKEFENFCIYHTKNGKEYVNWYAAWQTWVRNYFEFGHDKASPKLKVVTDNIYQ